MGFGKKLKKLAKRVERAVSSAAKKVEREVSRTSRDALGNVGYDFVKGAGQYGKALTGVSALEAGIKGNNPYDATKDGLKDGIQRQVGVQRLQDEAKAEAKESAAAAAAYARRLEEQAKNEAMAQKKAMIAEQESQSATPVSDSYLGSSGALGRFVKDDEKKQKKKLGGNK